MKHRHKWVIDRESVNCDICFMSKKSMLNYKMLDKVKLTKKERDTLSHATRIPIKDVYVPKDSVLKLWEELFLGTKKK